jgi:hypothetical protein
MVSKSREATFCGETRVNWTSGTRRGQQVKPEAACETPNRLYRLYCSVRPFQRVRFNESSLSNPSRTAADDGDTRFNVHATRCIAVLHSPANTLADPSIRLDQRRQPTRTIVLLWRLI